MAMLQVWLGWGSGVSIDDCAKCMERNQDIRIQGRSQGVRGQRGCPEQACHVHIIGLG